MAIRCPNCGAEYDVTLFTFDRSIRCDCGASVDLDVGHRQTDQVPQRTPTEIPMPRSIQQLREANDCSLVIPADCGEVG